MKNYWFRLKVYIEIIVILSITIVLGYLIAPTLLNYPPHSELSSFQLKVEPLTHVQQYVIVFLLLSFLTLAFISYLYRDIFRLFENRKVKKTISEIRQKTFYIPMKLTIMQIIFMIMICINVYFITPNSDLIVYFKIGIFYITLAGCCSVISDFVLSPDLKKFIIWSSKYEENFEFNFKKTSFKSRVLQRILPLITIVIIVITFLSYSLTIKEIGERKYSYYRNEVQKIDLEKLDLGTILGKLNSIPKLDEEDYYFYSLNEDEFIGSGGQNISSFLIEYTKSFVKRNNGHIYDYFGIENEGYAQTIKLPNGQTIYLGFIFSTSDTNILLLYCMVFIGTILLSIVYLKVYGDSISTDITNVAKNLNNIANEERDTLVEKIPISSNDEIGEIVSAYNKIQDINQNYINELNIAKDQAEQANNFKTEFLSSMSHEIRTPLNAIVGFSQALIEENIAEEAKDEVNDIIMASNNLLEIVNGILDISKIEAGKLEIINSEYSFKKVLDDLVALTNARLGDKPIEFKTSFDPSVPPFLYGDQMRLKQIVLNLLTNSVKYTNEGYIEFKVVYVIREDVCRLIISVEDSGIGIKPDKIDKLFAKFERLEVEKNTTAEGTGLGLAITKKLVELMGGKIVVQSVFGKGSRFTVAVNQRVTSGDSLIEKEEAKINSTLGEDFDITGKKILIVDDNKINLKVATRLLQNYKVDTTEVMNGADCLDLINKGAKYDLILMDDMMPKMSGTQTFHKLKEIPEFKTPIIALTANAIAGMKEKYLSEGFDDYLAKPIERPELDRVLKKFLHK